MFGSVGWSVDGRFEAVNGSMRAGLLVVLAEQRGSTVSIDTILSRLWSEPPRSGANAVQRHVSSVRTHLATLGVTGDVIESVPGGYRLSASVSTDLHVLEAAIGADATDAPAAVMWWNEPLVGAPYEASLTLRQRLERLAHQALTRWSEHGTDDDELVLQRIDAMLGHSPHRDEIAHVRLKTARRIDERTAMHIAPASLESLRDVIGSWMRGETSTSLDLLDELDCEIPDDIARRLCRALIWLSPSDNWSRHAMSLLVQDAISQPEQHERLIISLDARVLEAQSDGIDIAEREVQTADTPAMRLRALRVQYFLSLSSPPDDARSAAMIGALAGFDHPDAEVEQHRFAFLEALRCIDIAGARTAIECYANTVQRLWPRSGDDFAPMATAMLQRSVDDAVRHAFGPARPTALPAFAMDPWVLPVAEAVRSLVLRDPAQPLRDGDFHLAADVMSSGPERAMHLLRDMNTGRPVGEQATSLAADLGGLVREKQFLFVPVALCLAAEALRDRDIATAAAASIEPWAGRALGMWPADAYFGPADRWLDRLASV